MPTKRKPVDHAAEAKRLREEAKRSSRFVRRLRRKMAEMHEALAEQQREDNAAAEPTSVDTVP